MVSVDGQCRFIDERHAHPRVGAGGDDVVLEDLRLRGERRDLSVAVDPRRALNAIDLADGIAGLGANGGRKQGGG